jgi:hypothetical protein
MIGIRIDVILIMERFNHYRGESVLTRLGNFMQ